MMDITLNVLVKRFDERATLPSYAHTGDAGMDLSSVEKVWLWGGSQAIVRTGLALDIPFGYVGLIHPRSGMAFKHGITIVNAPGTIDSGYRGEIKVCLLNTSSEHYRIDVGDRIAQIVFQAISYGVLHEVADLSDSVRSVNGFGSTGV